MRSTPRSVVRRFTISSVSWKYDARMLITLSRMVASRRNSAPVKGPMYGTPAALATGVAERDVGVPTAPMSAKTSCSLMSLRVFVAAASGS